METGSRAWLEEDVVCLARLVKSFGPRDLDTIMRRGGRAVAGRPVNDVRVMLEAIQKHYGFDASNRRSPAHAYEEERKAASTTPDSQQSGDERVNGRGNGTAGAHDSTRAHEEVIEISSGSSSVEEEEEEIEVSSGSEVVEVADSAEHFEPPREESGFETSTSEALGGSGNANSEANTDADAGAEDEGESSIDRRNSCEGEMRHTDSFHGVDKDEVKRSNSFQRADKEEWERRNEVIRRESLKARLERKRKKEQVLRLEQRVKHHRLEVNAAERELEERNRLRPEILRQIQYETLGSTYFPTLVSRLGIADVAPHVSAAAATKLYRICLLKFHPDRVTKLASIRERIRSEEIFKLLQASYKTYAHP